MFKNLSLQARIALVAGVPFLVAMFFMGNTIKDSYQINREMEQAETFNALATHISSLVHETQKERGASGLFMGSRGTKFVSELDKQRKVTDTRVSELNTFLSDFDSGTQKVELAQALAQATNLMRNLPDYRKQASSLNVPAGVVLGLYTQHNTEMLNVISIIAKSNGDAELAQTANAYLNFLLGKERAGIERAVMSKTFAEDVFSPGTLRKFGALVTAQETYFHGFLMQASADQIAFYKGKMSDPAIDEVQRMRDIAFGLGEVKADGFGVKPGYWFKTMTTKINLMKEVESQLVADLGELAAQKRTSARTNLVVACVLALVSTVIVALLVFLVSRSIMHPFQRIFRGLKSFSTAELNETSEIFNRIIDGMTDSMLQVNDASEQVAGASQDLAETTSEQAASLEETAASLEEMAAMTTTNSENAKRADELSTQNHAAAQKGNESMIKLSEASKMISSIIKAIEEIAFQTNLLALNAAVEAARAGDHGKGFAVVAEEVRGLAKRASDAAGETGTLIANSVQLSNEGAVAVQEIVTGVAEVSDLVDGISKASEQQAKGVGEVNAAVGMMDSVVQKNAASAEESAAAAEELSAQAAATQSLVDELVVLVKGSVAQPAPRRAVLTAALVQKQQPVYQTPSHGYEQKVIPLEEDVFEMN